MKFVFEEDIGMYLIRCFTKNWGDDLNVPLVEFISGKTPDSVRRKFVAPPGESTYLVLGSILHWADENTIVWGSGFISADRRMSCQPKELHAVRGPKSREILLAQGIDCPKVFGDPALLYPRFYKLNIIEKKYKLGIIPHHIDKGVPLLEAFQNEDGILVIDIQGSINQVVDDICSCERVASSCLHGVICADSYGIPSTWIKFSDRVIGGGFKFRDYFASVGRKDVEPLVMEEEVTVQQVLDQFYDYKIDIDLDKLYDMCPFRRKD